MFIYLLYIWCSSFKVHTWHFRHISHKHVLGMFAINNHFLMQLFTDVYLFESNSNFMPLICLSGGNFVISLEKMSYYFLFVFIYNTACASWRLGCWKKLYSFKICPWAVWSSLKGFSFCYKLIAQKLIFEFKHLFFMQIWFIARAELSFRLQLEHHFCHKQLHCRIQQQSSLRYGIRQAKKGYFIPRVFCSLFF